MRVIRYPRAATCYEPNDPGLRSGAMRDSVWFKVGDNAVQIGSDDQKLVWFELGTTKQPPRPALEGALKVKTPEVLRVIGRSVVGKLTGEAREVDD